MYHTTTQDIAISVVPQFLPEQSDAQSLRWVWSYTITIANNGSKTVQLMDRYWSITDEKGKIETVSGPGVVGEQPILNPGDSYTYTSGCRLETPSGIMQGHYRMSCQAGGEFLAEIPAFSLDTPRASPFLN